MSVQTNAKRSERESARYLLKIDGPDLGTLGNLTTSTGRIGDIYRLQFDFVSKHYIGENKCSTRAAKNPGCSITKEIIQKVVTKARAYKKEPLLVIHVIDCRPLHAIAATRHAHLLACERVIENNGLLKEVKEEIK